MGYAYGTEEWESAYRGLVEERLGRVDKPYVMGSPEWVASFEKLVQDDDQYKEVAKTWEGTVVIHILPKPEIGLNCDIYELMDLWHGDCRSIKLVPGDIAEKADFILTGEYERWESVVKGELDVVKAMMQGKIKLKGSLPKIVRYVKASKRLVDLAAQVDTQFHTDMEEEKRAEYSNWFDGFCSSFRIN